MIGIGDKSYKLAVYISNRPPLKEYQFLDTLMPAEEGELARIGHEAGNHWRKIINIYAKLGFSLSPEGYSSWQNYRDLFLLSKHSKQALVFDDYSENPQADCIKIICGKTYAATIIDNGTFVSIDDDFSIDKSKKIIVSPYFDYRQLSNLKLETLVALVQNI
jgi:hypothetical protein